MVDLDLFGDPVTYPKGRQSNYQKFKHRNHYRKAESDEKCKYCRFHHVNEYNNKRYHKCELIGDSMSEATDIRAGHVCYQFKWVRDVNQDEFWERDEEEESVW